jgi:hypothetical protein
MGGALKKILQLGSVGAGTAFGGPLGGAVAGGVSSLLSSGGNPMKTLIGAGTGAAGGALDNYLQGLQPVNKVTSLMGNSANQAVQGPSITDLLQTLSQLNQK